MIMKRVSGIKGELSVPGDKSISHRAVMLGSLAEGTTRVTNFLNSADCLSTISCFAKMGISIKKETISSHGLPGKKEMLLIKGRGLYGLKEPAGILDTGNSGTTTRLLCGILAAQKFKSYITGDSSIQKRPMERVIKPLSFMGAELISEKGNGCVPLMITGKHLKGIHYHSPVASAQVKSAILLAGLYADGVTCVTEPFLSRNHTELMLTKFGNPVETKDTTVSITGGYPLKAQDVFVPSDISSAAYFIAAALLVNHSELLIKNVGINPTRSGMITILKQMGASIEMLNRNTDHQEPAADLLVKTSNLTGTTIGGSIIPALIDEIPILAVLACFAKGQTVIKDAAELKVKESNRIDVMVKNLSSMGADIIPTEDGMIINGGRPLHGCTVETNHDHRIAMSLAVAALAADGETTIKDASCIQISYPDFFRDLQTICEF